MTSINPTHSANPSIIGPFSKWPRRKVIRTPAAVAGLVGAAGVFAHCIVPMLFGA